MAPVLGQTRRHRASTGASRVLDAEEIDSTTATLIQKLSEPGVGKEAFSKATAAAESLQREFDTNSAAKDVFRRGRGFEAALQLFQRDPPLVHSELNGFALMLGSMLLMLSKAIKDHRGNNKYFRSYLDGWNVLQKALLSIQSSLLQREDRALPQYFKLILIGLLKSAGDGLSDGLGIEIDESERSEAIAESSNAAGRYLLRDADACAIAVRLSLQLIKNGSADDTELLSISVSLWKLVTSALEASARSRVLLWNTGLLSDLLPLILDQIFPSEIKDSLERLYTSLVSLGLPSLDDVAFLFQQSSKSDHARELLLTTLQESSWPPFIQFDLSLFGYSSIEFPSLPRAFPPISGYTLTAWIRIDNFDKACHTTLFGAFDSSQACFILTYLEKDSHQLILQTSIRSSRPSVRFRSVRFSADRWYHLALVHKKNASDSRQSSAALFVDGEFAEQVKCAYPEAPPENEVKDATPSPGASAPAHSRNTKLVQAFFGTPHDLGVKLGQNEITSKWSLARAHLYQVPLTDEYVAVHHRLGPRYCGNLQDCLGPLLTYKASAELNRYNELLHPDKSEKSDIITATEHRGSDVVAENRLIISISPATVIYFDGVNGSTDRRELDRKAFSRYQHLAQKSKAVAVNAAVPTLNEAISRSYGAGILTGEPVVAIPKALDDASWCLIGTLPVLTQLLESASSKIAFLQSVQIFFECVADNWRISEAMEKGNGFGILKALIREKLGFESVAARKPSTALSLDDQQSIARELLQLILSFVGYNKDKPENSMIVNPMAYRVLLIDFDTWRRCDLDTQKLYYNQFAHFVSHNKHLAFNQKRLMRMRAVKRLLEVLKSEEFCTEAIPSVIEALRALLDNNSAGSMYRELAMFVTFGLQDDRAMASNPVRNMASIVNLRKKTTMWARSARSSKSATPAGSQTPQLISTRTELAIQVLELLRSVLCEDQSGAAVRRFNRAVPNRWALHLLAESNSRVVSLTMQILSQLLAKLGADFKAPFINKNGGFITLKSRLRTFWSFPTIWLSCFAIMFGCNTPGNNATSELTLFSLIDSFQVDDQLKILNPETLSTIMAMLETGLRHILRMDTPDEAEVRTLQTVIQFLSELYTRSVDFREFANSSRYVQEILFVLYPVLVGSDRLSAEAELQSDNDALSFKGEEVKLRPHSNSLGDRPPSVRSLNLDNDRRTPSPRGSNRLEAPKRLSSFEFVTTDGRTTDASPAQFKPVMAPKTSEPVRMKVGNTVVESLLELVVNLFLDLICNKEKFNGTGLFLKVPPGFKEHQAYFESYVLVHTLTQLWNHLQLDQSLFVNTRVLTNLARYIQHMSEAVFEGWFIDGAQPVLDFTGKVLEYLQQPDVAADKNVRLCSQNINAMRVVFLRVCLWRLIELDESVQEMEATTFLDKMDYWQTVLFSSDNQEAQFTRLICFLLYMKLTSSVQVVRLAAARLWRTILMQKPTETATLLTLVTGSEQRHLSTEFMRLVSMEEDEFVRWIDGNRQDLDKLFINSLNKPWSDFVSEENRKTAESAKLRLNRRRDKLRQWQTEDAHAEEFMHRYDISTNHWRSNAHAQERLKLQRSVQDHQENVNHLLAVFTGIDKLLRQPYSVELVDDKPKWQLDETEAVNRMRMRLVRDDGQYDGGLQPKRKASQQSSGDKLTINTQVNGAISDDIMSSIPISPLPGTADGSHELLEPNRPRSDSASNSQLLEGGFEMVEDPKEADDGIIEDKNRKILTSLQRGDVVQQLYNISRIVGLEACEGLLVLGKKCLYLQDSFFQRSDGEIVSVSQAPEDERDPYVQLISGKDVGSQGTKHSTGDQETRHWTWTEVLSISKRRFLFRDVSVEVFFTDGRSYLLTCMSSKVRDDLYNGVINRAPHVHKSSTAATEDAWRLDTLHNPEEGPQSFGFKFASVFNTMPSHASTKKWAKVEMSNFQYLMLVNTLAGRTFNDLTQYPVFPWVLADYHSDELDLANPRTFRDLSKPMGCQTKTRELEYKDRYKQFAEMGDNAAPPFHYGTHYSSAMIVSSYLIRLQPFVQSYLLLQGGSFDHADRLFDSIEKAWYSCSRDAMSDVRELTPEFFYLPEFLLNVNKYDFGAKQGSGEVVNEVKLPPWAKGDPHIFVAKHREALESPYVSANLHKWIDLVFGYKQRGEAAVEATNVFQHLSYQGAKDLDRIDDPVERLASIGIIHSFGQTPYQVFQKPHLTRDADKAGTSKLDTLAETLTRLPDPLFESDEKVACLSFSPAQERLLCAGPYKLNILPNCDRHVQWSFADNSIRFLSANNRRLLGLYENIHIGPITAAVTTDSKTLITAGKDCTIGLWGMSSSRDSAEIQPKTYLFGHRAAVVILAASRVFSTLVSASADGHVLLWALNRHQCTRVLHLAGSSPIQAANISNVNGHIVICQGQHLLLYTLNGHLLVKQKICESPSDEMSCCSFYEGSGNEWLERELILTGHTHGVAKLWSLTTLIGGAWFLQLVKQLNHLDPVRKDGSNTRAAITAVLPTPQAVYTGDEDGRVWEWDCLQRQGNISARSR